MVLEAHTASNAGAGVSASILPTNGYKLICTVAGQTWRGRAPQRLLLYGPFLCFLIKVKPLTSSQRSQVKTEFNIRSGGWGRGGAVWSRGNPPISVFLKVARF